MVSSRQPIKTAARLPHSLLIALPSTRGSNFRCSTRAAVSLLSDRSVRVSSYRRIKHAPRGFHSLPIAQLSAHGSSLPGQTLPVAPSRSAEEATTGSFRLISTAAQRSYVTVYQRVRGNSLPGAPPAHSLQR